MVRRGSPVRVRKRALFAGVFRNVVDPLHKRANVMRTWLANALQSGRFVRWASTGSSAKSLQTGFIRCLDGRERDPLPSRERWSARVASVGAIGATERDRLLPEPCDGGAGGAQIACKAASPRCRRLRAWRETGDATHWAIRGLVSRVAEGNERVERVPTEPQRCPAVALVAALPEPTVGEAGEQAAIGGEERVGHRR